MTVLSCDSCVPFRVPQNPKGSQDGIEITNKKYQILAHCAHAHKKCPAWPAWPSLHARGGRGGWTRSRAHKKWAGSLHRNPISLASTS